MEKKNILILTGAGISAESGVRTFRDYGGMWNDYKVEDVATIQAWNKSKAQKAIIMDFYNMRKDEMKSAEPNAGHFALVELEKHFNVTIVTQNVDDLHEKAGSTNIVHLHGELALLKSDSGSNFRCPYIDNLKIGDKCPDGYQLRPDVVWFGEELDELDLMKTAQAASEADVCIIIGTSMQVSPANSIPWLTPELCIVYYVDPSEVDFTIPHMRETFFYHIQKLGSIGVKEAVNDIISIFGDAK